MKCKICSRNIHPMEIYTTFYYCDICDTDYELEDDMPFKSKSQKNFLYSKKPEIAKEFAEHTSKDQMKKLPNKVKKKKNESQNRSH